MTLLSLLSEVNCATSESIRVSVSFCLCVLLLPDTAHARKKDQKCEDQEKEETLTRTTMMKLCIDTLPLIS